MRVPVWSSHQAPEEGLREFRLGCERPGGEVLPWLRVWPVTVTLRCLFISAALGVSVGVKLLQVEGRQPSLTALPGAGRPIPQVYQLGGICKLVDLLRSSNQNVQQAAAGALRNLVFRSTTNKLETQRQSGIREAVNLLRSTSCTEIQKQLTGGEPGHRERGGWEALGWPQPRTGWGVGGLRLTPQESHGTGAGQLVVSSW